MAPQKLLVVGGGLTGAVAAYRLRKSLGQSVDIECWEYLNDTGGRLATTKEQGVVADVATSVISLDENRVEVRNLQEALIQKGFLKDADASLLADSSERPAGSNWRHFFVPDGTSSLIDFLFQASKVKVKTNCCVDLCSLDAQKWKWYVEASSGKSGGSRHRGEFFDVVVLCNGPTHPGCERMDNIWGEWQAALDDRFWGALKKVSWSSCYVVTLSLTRDCLAACNTFFGEYGIQKAMNDDLIQYITYASRKHQRLTGKASSCVVLVCHTTADAMWYYRRAQCVEAVQDQVLQKYLKLPKYISRKVVQRAHSRCWGKCQVTRSISAVLGNTTTHWASHKDYSPPLVLCGDYFMGPYCSDAIVSATAAASSVAASLGISTEAETPQESMEVRKTPQNKMFLSAASGRWADEPIEDPSFDESRPAIPSAPKVPLTSSKRWAAPSASKILSSSSKKWGRNGPRTSL